MFCLGAKLQFRWKYHSGGWDDKHLHHFEILFWYEQQRNENSDDLFESLIGLCLKYVSLSNYVCVDMYRLYEYKHTRIYICEYIYICIYVYMYINIYVYVYFYTYIHMYIHMNIINVYVFIYVYTHVIYTYMLAILSNRFFTSACFPLPRHNYN